MAAPTLQAEGALAAFASGSVITAVNPAHQADDILVVVFEHNTTGNTFTTPTGWTPHPSGRQDSGAAAAGHCFWKRATGSAETDPSTTVSIAMLTGAGGYGRVYVIRGCETSGDPFDATAVAVANTATPDAPSLTTIGADRLVFYGFAIDDDNTFSAGFPPTGYTGGTHLTTVTGGDCAMNACWKAVAVAGTENPAAATMAASDPWFVWGLAFKPPAGGAAPQDPYPYVGGGYYPTEG